MHAGVERRTRLPARAVFRPLAHLVPGQETLARPSVPADCERRQENSGETKAVPRTAVQRLLSRRDIPLREKTLRRMLYETAAARRRSSRSTCRTSTWTTARRPSGPKGGAIQWVYWDTGTARLLPR
jgi:hypothetical protein